MNIAGSITTYNIMPILILFMTGLGGFTIGSQFPLAGQLFKEKNADSIKAAGILYSLDLLGAWSAGIIVSLFLIPILGMVDTILVFIIAKTGSVFVFFISSKVWKR
jgi:predicted membrane-bound spermidine synthase